jgi:hypothetical protein
MVIHTLPSVRPTKFVVKAFLFGERAHLFGWARMRGKAAYPRQNGHAGQERRRSRLGGNLHHRCVGCRALPKRRRTNLAVLGLVTGMSGDSETRSFATPLTARRKKRRRCSVSRRSPLPRPRSARQTAAGYVYHALNRAAQAISQSRRLRCLPAGLRRGRGPAAAGQLSSFVRWLTLTHAVRWHKYYPSTNGGHV